MRRDEAYLLDIYIASKEVIEFTQGVSREQFQQNKILQYALVRLLTLIGEAASNISQETRDANPAIPWGQISGMRNRLIHQYFRISLDIVWDTIQNDIPVLLKQVEPLIPPEDQVQVD